MRRALVLAGVALLTVTGGATAAPTWGPASWLAQPTDGAQYICCGANVAVNAQGDAVIGWQMYIGSTPVAMTAWRRAGAVDWSGPVRLAEGAGAPHVAVDSAGNSLALFAKGIAQTAYHPADAPSWDAPITIGGEAFGGLAVAFDGAGNGTAVWNNWRYPSIVAQTATRTASGTWQQPPVDISASTGEAWAAFSLAVNKSGDAVAAWEYETPENFRYVEAAIRPRGAAWEAPVRLTTQAAAAYSFTSPLVAIDESGGATVVWAYERGSVHAAYRPAGGPWMPDSEVASVGEPRGVAVQPGGAALVLFTVADRSSVFAASHTSATTPWSAPVALSDPARWATGAALTSDGRGNAIATWIEEGNSWEAPRTLRAALRPAASGRWEPAADVAKSASGGYSTDVAVDGSGRAIALWDPDITGSREGLQVVELRGGGPVLSRLEIPASGGTGVRTRFSVEPVPWAAPLVPQTQWEFGDGATAAGNAVQHVYTREGSYEVRVSAFASDGAGTETRTITVGKPTLANARRPVIHGVARVDRVVRCDRGTWNGTEPIAYAYSWLRNGSAVARGQSYRIRAADRGVLLACRVTATNGPKTAVARSRAVRVR